MRYFLRLAYNGTPFHGWQIQPNAITVQEVLNKALSMILRSEINVMGAGRTDAGVHAKEMFAHFDWDAEFDGKDLTHKLNRLLDENISIYSIFKVEKEEDHTRFTAISRTYEYVISTFKNPFLADGAYLFQRKLDVSAMNAAAQVLLGKRDFSCFSKSNTQTKTNICDLTFAKWEEKNGLLVFTITADRFLRNMVRAVTGTLLKVGLGEWSILDVEKILESKTRSEAGESVPAKGLYLVEVKYPEHIENKFERKIPVIG